MSSSDVPAKNSKRSSSIAAVATLKSNEPANKKHNSSSSGSSSTLALSDRNTLHSILSYVGPGHALYISTVSREWREVYLQVADADLAGVDAEGGEVKVTCTARMTLFSAVVASASRLQLAHACGLELGEESADCWRLHLAVGRYGETATLAKAHELGMKLGRIVSMGAARADSPHNLIWLVEERNMPLITGMLHQAIDGGNVEIVRWLLQQGCEADDDALEHAANNAHWDLVFYLHEEAGHPLTTALTTAAARLGDLVALQRLRAAGCPWDAGLISTDACRSGSIPLLRWLKEQGVGFTARTLGSAASRGHIDLCEYLLSVDCPMDASACVVAANYSQTATVRWLHEHGCPWNAFAVCVVAAECGNVELIQYVLANVPQGAAGAEALTILLNAAAACEQLEAAQWLRAQGAEWPTLLSYKTLIFDKRKLWKGATLEWARSEGCTALLPTDDADDVDNDDSDGE
jgi:hypothetical protein